MHKRERRKLKTKLKNQIFLPKNVWDISRERLMTLQHTFSIQEICEIVSMQL